MPKRNGATEDIKLDDVLSEIAKSSKLHDFVLYIDQK